MTDKHHPRQILFLHVDPEYFLVYVFSTPFFVYGFFVWPGMRWLKLGYVVFCVYSILACHVSEVSFYVLLDSGTRSVLMRRCWQWSDSEGSRRLPLLSWGPGGRGLGRDRREHGGGVGLILLPEPIKDNSSTLQADDMVDWEDTLNACLLQDWDRPKMKPSEVFCSWTACRVFLTKPASTQCHHALAQHCLWTDLTH